MTDHNETHEDYEKIMADMRAGFQLELASKDARIATDAMRIAELVKLLGEQREFTCHVSKACADAPEGHPCYCGLSDIDRRVNAQLVMELPF